MECVSIPTLFAHPMALMEELPRVITPQADKMNEHNILGRYIDRVSEGTPVEIRSCSISGDSGRLGGPEVAKEFSPGDKVIVNTPQTIQLVFYRQTMHEGSIGHDCQGVCGTQVYMTHVGFHQNKVFLFDAGMGRFLPAHRQHGRGIIDACDFQS